MTQTLHKREAPPNLGGGWAASPPFRSWSSCHRRRRGVPIYKRRQHYGPKAEYEPPRKQPKPRYGPGPWFQPPPSPYWSMYSNWGCWGGPWCPPPMGHRKPPSPGLVARMYGLHPVCLCCCFCWRGPWNPGWARAPVRKKRWGRRGRGLRRQPSRPVPRSPSVEVSPLLQPVDLCGWRAPPGLQAPRNTTQFIMNQIYEDMRQQEKLERQQEALRAQRAQAGGNEAPPSGDEDDADMQDALYGFGQNPALAFSPAPEEEENRSPAPQLVEEEEEEKDDAECDEEECDEEECDEEECDEECDGKDEESEEEESEEEEDEEAEAQDEEEVEEAEDVEEVVEEQEAEETEEKEEGLEEEEQRGEENHVPLEMPLSFLMAEEERANFIDCPHLSPEQVTPKVSPETLLMLQDTDY